MSHAAAFGHFRSCVLGLEKEGRALRKVFEDNDNAETNGKSINKKGNGKVYEPGLGISARCAQGE